MLTPGQPAVAPATASEPFLSLPLPSLVVVPSAHLQIEVLRPPVESAEYTSALFAQACTNAGVTQSMGRTGSALDNAVAESLNSTIEFELLREHHFTTRAQARRAVAAFIEEYNTNRQHSTCQMLPPITYEARAQAARREQEAA